MQIQYTLQLAELTFDAILKVFNRKKTFTRFLRSMGVKDSVLASFDPNETKREFLERLFPKMQNTDNGKKVILKMALEISEFKEFPDLKGYEDSSLKEKNARESVLTLVNCLSEMRKKISDEQERQKIKEVARQRAEEIKKERDSLSSFEVRLNELTTRLGTQKAGYEFQDWFYDLVDFYEVQCRRPFNSDGRQLDGSVSVSNTEYLVELKFEKNQADAQDIDSLYSKLKDKADNTLAIFVAMSGYSSVAVSEASKGRTMILLFDYNHIFLLLRGTINFCELIDRAKRHAAQTGEAYLSATAFSVKRHIDLTERGTRIKPDQTGYRRTGVSTGQGFSRERRPRNRVDLA